MQCMCQYSKSHVKFVHKNGIILSAIISILRTMCMCHEILWNPSTQTPSLWRLWKRRQVSLYFLSNYEHVFFSRNDHSDIGPSRKRKSRSAKPRDCRHRYKGNDLASTLKCLHGGNCVNMCTQNEHFLCGLHSLVYRLPTIFPSPDQHRQLLSSTRRIPSRS